MRKITDGGAVSLDGFIAGPGESIDWLRMSEDLGAIMAESWKGVDAMLMGRLTWEFAVRMGGGPDVSSKIRTYVFSRTMEAAPEGAELVSGDAVEFVRALKAQEGGDIILMGGGVLAASLIEAGLVDELGFNVHPVLLGGGTPAFAAMARRTELELIEARAIAKGCVLVRYRVAN